MITKTGRGLLLGMAALASLYTSAATRFDLGSMHQPLGSIAPLVLSNTDLSKGGVTAYRPWFENGAWQGDIVQYDVSTTGVLSTTLDFSGNSPAQNGTTPANWSALVKFAEEETSNPNYWTTRKIITAKDNAQKPFLWEIGNLNISAANRASLDQAAFDANATSSIILDWIRGDRSNEYTALAALRKRVSIMGDVIHSNPQYVGAPNSSFSENDYVGWANDSDRANREHRIYVGANDGMLHVFDAGDPNDPNPDPGSEVYAYIPSMLIPKLSKLVTRPYDHTYFVDGKLTTGDAWFNGAWHTVLLGTLGAGGRGVFALDITDPNLTTQSSTSGTDNKVMWEISAITNDPNNPSDDDLGDTFSRAVIAKLPDGKWYAAMGNGYNSINGEAMLYLIDLGTGDVKKVGTGSGTAGNNPNGLSTPRMIDANRDGAFDTAYAGDIDGNLWKFDLSSTVPASWVKAYPLHVGTANTAITRAPEVTRHPDGSFIVAFATGRLFVEEDILDATPQAMYGLRDPGVQPLWITNGTTQTLVSQPFVPKTFFDPNEPTTASVAVYSPDAGSVTTQDGWKVEFPTGFRSLEAIQIRGGRAKVTMSSPTIAQNWITEGVTLDGGPSPTPIFDLNSDGILNAADLVDGNGDLDVLDSEDVPMAWQRPDGIMSQVTIARIANGIDTLFLNFLVPPADEPCTEDCGGFQGGHIDVDTWLDTAPFAGVSTKHEHEYDKKVDRVFVDFFDLNVPLPAGAVLPREASTGHVEIDSTGIPAPSSGIDPNEPFVVLVANADFSRGSTMQIGSKSMSVVQYQKEIHIGLRDWDATDVNDVPVDSDGDPLIFTWSAIQAAGGTIKHSFNDVAILAGGLHPTQIRCVKDTAYGDSDGTPTTYDPATRQGRWRNGALTTQLVKASHFSSSSALDDVTIQDPNDFDPIVETADGQISMFDPNSGEEYSGLIATSGTEHIWESTLFWHFGNLFDLIEGGRPCYGEADWDSAVALETAENPFAAALEAKEITDLNQEILDSLSCSAIEEVAGGCKTYFKLLLNLLELRDDYTPTGGPGGVGGGDGGDGETPVNMGGGTPEQGTTSGPSFDFGRLGWTDVVPN